MTAIQKFLTAGLQKRGWKLMACLLLAMGGTSFALDITTSDGVTYVQCKIGRPEGDVLSVEHRDGIARIPYEKLLPELQQQYFNPQAVEAYRAKLEEGRHAAKAAAAAADAEARGRAEAARNQEQARLDQAAVDAAAEVARQAVRDEQERKRLKTEQVKIIVLTLAWIAAGLLLFAAGIFGYFLPTYIGRRKVNARAIFFLNLLLGWTFVGWVVALVWASTRDSALETMARRRLESKPDEGNYLE